MHAASRASNEVLTHKASRLSMREIVGALAALIYVVLVHWTNTRTAYPLLGVVLTLSPFLLLVGLSIFRSFGSVWVLLFGAGIALSCWVFQDMLLQSSRRIFLFEHVSSNIFLCLFFGRTLFQQREPLVTRFARMSATASTQAIPGVPNELPAAVLRYTRSVTWAWTIFFALIASTSLVLYVFAPVMVWSAFASLLNLPLLAAMFVGEYLIRLRIIGSMQSGSIMDGVRAFRQHQARGGMQAAAPVTAEQALARPASMPPQPHPTDPAEPTDPIA